MSLVSDAADELGAAAKIVGCSGYQFHHFLMAFLTIPNMSVKSAAFGGVRSSFLEADFAIRPELWRVAYRYGSMALNLTHSAPAGDTVSRWDFCKCAFWCR